MYAKELRNHVNKRKKCDINLCSKIFKGKRDCFHYCRSGFFSEMPPRRSCVPARLEDQCLQVYLNYLHDEVHMLFYLKNFHHRSVLLAKMGLDPDKLYKILQYQLSNKLQVCTTILPKLKSVAFLRELEFFVHLSRTFLSFTP